MPWSSALAISQISQRRHKSSGHVVGQPRSVARRGDAQGLLPGFKLGRGAQAQQLAAKVVFQTGTGDLLTVEPGFLS